MRPMCFLRLLVFTALGSLLGQPAPSLAFSGTVTRVTDGDTLWVRPDGDAAVALKVRVEGIDAPERCQAWGREATAALRAKVLNRKVEIPERGRDPYGRLLGDVLLDGTDVGCVDGGAGATRGPIAIMVSLVGTTSLRPSRKRSDAACSPTMTPCGRMCFRRIHGPCPVTY